MTTSSADCTTTSTRSGHVTGMGRTWIGTIHGAPMTPLGPVDLVLHEREVVIFYGGSGRRATVERSRFREWFFRGAGALETGTDLVLEYGRRAFTLTYAERPWTAPGVVVRDLAWSLADDEDAA